MRTVLNAVSLDVAAGEYVAVIGDSGIGKFDPAQRDRGAEPVTQEKCGLRRRNSPAER